MRSLQRSCQPDVLSRAAAGYVRTYVVTYVRALSRILVSRSSVTLNYTRLGGARHDKNLSDVAHEGRRRCRRRVSALVRITLDRRRRNIITITAWQAWQRGVCAQGSSVCLSTELFLCCCTRLGIVLVELM